MLSEKFPDLMSLDDILSLAREPFAQGDIKLAECNIASMPVSEQYTTIPVSITSGSTREMEGLMDYLAAETKIDFRQLKLYAPLYEALLNAFQHGNMRDTLKPIRFHYKVSDSEVELLVEDEGGIINPNFIPFVLRHHNSRCMEKPTDFYTFCGIRKPETNNGTGTFFIHKDTDEVTYHKSQRNGLIVRMVKNLDKKDN